MITIMLKKVKMTEQAPQQTLIIAASNVPIANLSNLAKTSQMLERSPINAIAKIGEKSTAPNRIKRNLENKLKYGSVSSATTFPKRE